MSVEYSFNVGFGFLVNEDDVKLPGAWPDIEEWYSGDIDEELAGSGVVSQIVSNQMSGPRRWGFMAEGTVAEMDKYSRTDLIELREPDPSTISNIWDVMTSCGVNARVGWIMWMDVN